MKVMDRMTVTERRAQILRIAAEEFAQTGLHGTSAETIARRADISQPYIFRLFTTKKGLFVDVVEGSFDKITESFEEAAQGLSGTEALYAMGVRYRSLLHDRTFLLIQLHGFAACADPDVRETMRRGYGRMWATLQKHSGADDATVKRFLALGMMLNGMAAMDLRNVDERWAQAFLTPLALDEFLGISIRSPGPDEV
jgi:AcrR family transcriptional regulator